jgi:tRNA-2-methylthio-N6-dimethylallyladenosine synthase
LHIIEKLRHTRPDIAFSSDFIVGFPGETDQAFENTLKLVEKVNYSQAYSFKYSRRPGTPGSIMTEHVSEVIKKVRLSALQEILNTQQLDFNSTFIGKSLDVLIERRRKDKQLVGKSPYMQAVHILEGQYQIGDILKTKVLAADKNSLKGDSIQLLAGANN